MKEYHKESNIFCDENEFSGIKNLPYQMWDEFCKMQTQLLKEEGVEVNRGGVKTPELPGISYNLVSQPKYLIHNI